MWLPQFDIEGAAREPGPRAVRPSVDDLEAEIGVERLGLRERFDLEEPRQRRLIEAPHVAGTADLDAVALRIMKVQRAHAPEFDLLEVERLGETRQPPIVRVGGTRERVMGVKPAPRDAVGATEPESRAAAGGDRDFAVGFGDDRNR